MSPKKAKKAVTKPASEKPAPVEKADDAAILAMYGVLDDLGPLEVTAVVALAAEDKAGQEEDAAAVAADLGGDAAHVLHAMRRRSAAE